jgi:murein DD-endopeptidase MepM/ murein hydrolase activator NlpD
MSQASQSFNRFQGGPRQTTRGHAERVTSVKSDRITSAKHERVTSGKTIIIQTANSRKVYNVSKATQFSIVFFLIFFGLWSGVATFNWLTAKEDNLAELAKVTSLLETYKTRNVYLEEERDRMSASLDDAELRFAEVTQKMVSSAAGTDSVQQVSTTFLEQMETVEKRIDTVVQERNMLSSKLEKMRADYEKASVQLAEYEQKIGNASTQNQENRAMLSSLSDRLTQAVKERDELQAQLRVMRSKVTQSTADMQSFGTDHERAIAELERIAAQTLQNVRNTLGKTGIDVGQILGNVRDTEEAKEFMGQGGPYIPIDKLAVRGEHSFQAALRLQTIFDQFEEINLLTIASDKIPFGLPTIAKRLSSGFGYRKDPFRKRVAFHSGLDFAGPVGTPIYSTSDGTVVFAGRKNGYGNVVEINHGIGFTTRYAHLDTFSVAVGQKVRQGEHIARMGNTGRSTGSHLHYEIRYKGKALNPANFTSISP